MRRRKLVFFARSDPMLDVEPLWAAYHFAYEALEAGLEAEVRVAAGAVAAALPDGFPETARASQVRDKIRAGASRGLLTTF